MRAVRARLAARNPWLYPALIGVVAGILVGALLMRLAAGSPRQSPSALGASSLAAGGRVPGGRGSTRGRLGADGGGLAATGPDSSGAGPGSGDLSGAGSSAGPGVGGQSATGGTAGLPPGGTASGTLTASDVGVTASTIKVGFVLLDLGGASAFGAAVPGFDPKVQQQEWQTFVDAVNKGGGINGRKLQAFYAKADPVDTNSQRQACLQLTQDDKVFLVVNAASGLGTSELCVTAENRTLDVSGQLDPTEYFQRSGGLLISQQQNGDRWFADWANALDHIGELRGRHLGILTDQDRADLMVNGGLVPSLRRRGYSVTYLADVSGDPERGPSEIPVQLQQMRLKGVDTVFLATQFVNATAFVNDADKQGWRPQYLTSDWSGDDVGTLLGGMPQSFDGAIAITDYGFNPSPTHPETPGSVACGQKWNALTGQHMTPDNGQDYANIVEDCMTMQLVTAAATRAGPDLTRAGFSGAVQAMGAFDWGDLGGYFGPGRLDWAQNMRSMIWGAPQGPTADQNCNPSASRCWNDNGPAINPE